jgi:hypothetical protein
VSRDAHSLWPINLIERGPGFRFDAAVGSITEKKRMLTRMRTLMVSAVLLALVGLGVAGGRVFAAQSGSPAADAAYQVFVAKLANNLGVTDPTKVDAAIRTTLKQMVNDQLAAGTISANKATELKKKIDAADQPGKLLGLDGFAVKTNPSTVTGNGGNAANDGNGDNDTGNGADNHGGNAGLDDDANGVDNHGGNAGADDDAGNGIDNHGGNTSTDDDDDGNAAVEDNHGGNAGADDNGGNETTGDNSDDGNAAGDDHGGDSSGHGGDDGGSDHGDDSGNSGHSGGGD